MNDRHIGPYRRHCRQLLTCKRTKDRADQWIVLRQIAPSIAPHHRKRQIRCTRDVRIGEVCVAVLFNLEWMRPFVLHGIAQAMQRPDTGIATPRENQLPRASRANQLIEDHIRRHAYQRKVVPLLSNHLMPCRKRDQMREPLHRQHIAVMHHVTDCIAQRTEVSHENPPLSLESTQPFLGNRAPIVKAQSERLCAMRPSIPVAHPLILTTHNAPTYGSLERTNLSNTAGTLEQRNHPGRKALHRRAPHGCGAVDDPWPMLPGPHRGRFRHGRHGVRCPCPLTRALHLQAGAGAGP